MKNYKPSFYLIISDPIFNNKFQLLYSTRTTARTLLSIEAVQNILHSRFNLLEFDTFQKLLDNKMIVDINENELFEVIESNNHEILNNSELSFVIQPSADCQLGCGYCGQVHSKKSMNSDFYDKIINRIKSKLSNNQNYNLLSITWFGAEPLMGLSKIKDLTLKLRKLATEFKCEYIANMTTNGLSLKKDIFFDLSKNYGIKNFEITLDGTEEFHDSKRHTKKGEKTYEIITKNLSEILNSPELLNIDSKVSIRCNVDKTNKDNVFALIDDLEIKKILNKINKFYIAPVHSWGNDAHLNSLSKEEYAKLEMEIFIKLLKKGFSYSSLLPNTLKKIVCLALEKDGELIDTFGDIYNCTEISQVETYTNSENIYKIDNLKNIETPYLDKRPLSNWNNDVIDGKFPCSTCSILPICGGACPKLWYEDISPCPIIKYNIKDRLLFDLHKDYKENKLNFKNL